MMGAEVQTGQLKLPSKFTVGILPGLLAPGTCADEEVREAGWGGSWVWLGSMEAGAGESARGNQM